MCIGYAFRPHLSSRLTRSGRTFLLNPQSFGHYDSHIILATHSGILTCMQSTAASAATSPRIQRSPTIRSCFPYLHFILLRQFGVASRRVALSNSESMKNNCESQASVYNLAPLNFRRRVISPVKFSAQGHSTSELLRTLLMSGCF